MKPTGHKNKAIGAQQYKLEKDKYFLQVDGMWFEFLKHMTTISTGVIIIIATLLGNKFIIPKSSSLILFSFSCFIISLVGSVLGMLAVMPYRSEKHKLKYERSKNKFHIIYEDTMTIFAGCVSIFGFLGGILIFLYNINI